MKKEVLKIEILKNEELEKGIFDMVLKSEQLSSTAKAGQFIKIYLENDKHLLPRPISICEIDKENATIRIIYKVLGKGTAILSKMQTGEKLKVIGNCGNGYTIFEEEKTHLLVGGGIGIPPLLETCKQLKGEKIVVLGFRSEQFLVEDFQNAGAKVYIATDDGSFGFKGNVVELIKKENLSADYIYACGPKPMLKSLTEFAKEKEIHTQVSLEERMACGTGTCIGCVAKIANGNDFEFKRVCKDGPVFNALEVVYDA